MVVHRHGVPTLTNLLERYANVRENIETNQQQVYASQAHITYLQEQLSLLPEQARLSGNHLA